MRPLALSRQSLSSFLSADKDAHVSGMPVFHKPILPIAIFAILLQLSHELIELSLKSSFFLTRHSLPLRFNPELFLSVED